MQNRDSDTNPSGTNPPVGVDLLGQSGSSSEQFSPTDHSCRSLETVVRIRESVRQRGGQPQ
ncbi:MAG TPA: hypothetical protein DCP31_09955 [Cyanobacteria bacterium UBA8543]|nr:hypothetical protein [Cyanobacteria bacterium UBA8543]